MLSLVLMVKGTRQLASYMVWGAVWWCQRGGWWLVRSWGRMGLVVELEMPRHPEPELVQVMHTKQFGSVDMSSQPTQGFGNHKGVGKCVAVPEGVWMVQLGPHGLGG
jgi:hypothetical protein